jgi:hypothetical protein
MMPDPFTPAGDVESVGSSAVDPDTSLLRDSDNDVDVEDAPAPTSPPSQHFSDPESSPVPNKQATNNDDEDWEDELDERVGVGSQSQTEIRGWQELREQVKDDLKTKAKALAPSQINQLMIIRNFATLRLKGQGWMGASLEIAHQWHEGEGTHFARRVRALARYYQVFEHLPKECRGGAANSRSLLEDENTRAKARDWLTSQHAGEATPCRFQKALNDTLLPSLGIVLESPLSECTACCWLIKLGWWLTLIHKGVYKDGHECDDVVKYRRERFLPQMAKWEARMVHYEGPELKQVNPTLHLGEKEVIPCFHDECCFHANDFKSQAW